MLFITDRTHAVGPRVAVETAAGGTEHGHVALIGLLGHLSENERFLLRTRHESRQHNVKCEAKTGLIKRLYGDNGTMLPQTENQIEIQTRVGPIYDAIADGWQTSRCLPEMWI